MTRRFASAREFVTLLNEQGMTGGLAAKKALREATGGMGLEVLSQMVDKNVGPDAPALKNASNYAELLGLVMGEITTGTNPTAYEKALTDFLNNYGFIGDVAKNRDVGAAVSAHPPSSRATETSHPDEDMDALDSLLAGDDFDLPSADEALTAQESRDNIATDARKSPTADHKKFEKNADTAPISNGINSQTEDTVAKSETPTPDYDPLTELDDLMFEKHWDGSTASGQTRIASGELMKLPGILPPPPEGGSPESYGAWLEGDVWNPLSLAIKLSLKDEDNLDDLIEMQSEFYALPESAMQTYGARKPADPETGRAHAQFIHYASRDLGQITHTYDTGHEMLSKAVARYFEENEPLAAEFLNRVGYNLKADMQLINTVCGALDIERFFLSNGPADAGEGRLSDLRGAVSSAARLDVPYMLDRALLLHFGSGVSLATGLHDTLIELRHAQLSRHLGRDVSPFEFDPAFKRDWFTELDEYEMSREEDHLPSPM